jgi:hypothetical protein
MQVAVMDITDYLAERRRMRLLPNLADLGIAYGIFRPVINLPANLRLFAYPAEMSISAWLYSNLVTDPLGFLFGALLYCVFALLQAAFKGLVGVKIKMLVLSDSAITIWIFAVVLLFYCIGALWLGRLMGGGAYYLGVALPGIYLYACYRYLRGLSRFKRHVLYRHLVSVPRGMFAYSTIRYEFFSVAALSIFWKTARSAGKLALAYLLIGMYLAIVLMLPQSQLGNALERWLKKIPFWSAVVTLILAFLLISQPVAYARRFVAESWIQWTTRLREHLARSASDVSQRDERRPILFLRSFRDDEIEIPAERYWGNALLGIRNKKVRLEEVLAETAFAVGPLVACSNPEDVLRPLGAARDNVSNETWQEEIGRFMWEASWIVLLVGTTKSLRWEMAEILRRGFLPKTLIVFPPGYREKDNAESLIVNALPELAKILQLTDGQHERKVLDGALLFTVSQDGRGVVIRQDGEATERGYGDAVRLAFDAT